jgi:hypothetical protein
MSDLFKRFTRAREKAVNDWQRNFVASYGSAYSNARAKFKETLDLQEKADREEREFWSGLAMFALSLCGGSALTMVFGNATAKAAAGKVALDIICENNMNRAFKVANFVSTNKTADFILGELWDKGVAAVSEKLKSSLTEDSKNYAAIDKFTQEPQAMQNNLWQWVLDAHAKVLEAEEEFDKIGNEGEKTGKIESLMKSPFFRSAPAQRPNETFLAGDIEFTFYMNMILDSDYTESGYFEETQGGRGWRRRVTSKTPITASPSSTSYPSAYKSQGSMGGVDFQQTEYKQYGSIIRDRINELSTQRFRYKMFGAGQEYGITFFDKGEKVSHKLLLFAERRLNEMGSTNLEKIKQSLAKQP